MDRDVLQPDTRASITVVTSAGREEALGWVVRANAEAVALRTRSGLRELAWSDIADCRRVGVPRGRDPLRTSSQRLDDLAQHAGLRGRKFLIRLSQLLDGRVPVRPFGEVHVDGEWGVCAGGDGLIGRGWAASHADARNLLVIAEDDQVAGLLALGFTEVRS